MPRLILGNVDMSPWTPQLVDWWVRANAGGDGSVRAPRDHDVVWRALTDAAILFAFDGGGDIRQMIAWWDEDDGMRIMSMEDARLRLRAYDMTPAQYKREGFLFDGPLVVDVGWPLDQETITALHRAQQPDENPRRRRR